MRGATLCFSLTLIHCGIDGEIDLLPRAANVASTSGDAADGSGGSADGAGTDDTASDATIFEASAETATCPPICVAPTPRCDATLGTCVACLEDQDCATALDRHLCDPSAHRCVECLLDSDCKRELSAACDLARGDCIH
jgi:hypothetical protein